jgi:glutamate-5-semialdehyde dehydrogenase
MFAKENVKLHSGPKLFNAIKFAPPLAKNLHHEYSDLELTIELVDGVEGAIEHINTYGSNHTDTIVTKSGKFK